MRFVKEWVTPHSGILVVTATEVLDVIGKYIQSDERSLEAGGILLGYRRGPHFQITHATEPTKYDKRSRFHFERSSQIHADTALEWWRASSGHITYIGEWHTHPEANPIPSTLDRREWRVLAKTLPRNMAYVMAIAGTEQLWTGLTHQSGSVVEMIPVI